MAELGTYYITIMPSMSKFTAAVNSAMGGEGGKAANKFSGGFMDVLKGSAIGTMVGNFASQLGGELWNGLSVGIKRLDTLENYPRVMEALGYSAEDAASSVKRIMEHLDGLPTTTQDMVTLTQSIADSTGDLDLATRAALGFNDMMLANGASAGEMTQAMGVFNRVLGKGNATTAQWMSLQSVMPAQLNMVARELMGESASAEDLREALNEGTVSWDDFLEAIARLDEEGSGDVKSFAEQARANVDGIGTAIENIPNRIGQGWAEILKALGRSNVSGVINDMSYGIRDAMKEAAKGVKWFVDAIAKTDIAEHFAQVMGKVGEALSGLWNDGGPGMLKAVAQGIVDLIDGALDWLADNGDLVTAAIWGIVGAVSAFAGIKIGTWLTTLPATFGALTTALMANPFFIVAGAIAALVMALYGFFTQTETGRQMWSDFCAAMSDLWQGLQDDFGFLMQRLSEEWESFKNWVSGIPEFWKGVMDGVVKGAQDMADGLKRWWDRAWRECSDSWKRVGDTVRQAWEGIKTDVSTFAQGVVDGIRRKWEDAKAATSTAWENVKGATSAAWEAVKGAVSQKVEAVRQAIADKFGQAKNAAATAFDAIKTSVSEKLQGAWDAVTQRVGSIRDSLANGFGAARDTVLGVFDAIRNGIEQKIQAARDFVSRTIDGIKGLFNFSWSLPRPSLPHIEWHWNNIGGLLSIPVFDGITWYGKGGVFDAATIIGIGEQGKEAALPMNSRTYGEIARGISEQMGAGGVQIYITGNEFNVRDDDDIDRIVDGLSERVLRQMGAAA